MSSRARRLPPTVVEDQARAAAVATAIAARAAALVELRTRLDQAIEDGAVAREVQRWHVDALDATNVRPTPQGGLSINSRPTKVGVLAYGRSDGSVWYELRAPEEVFDPASIATLADSVLTIGHPWEAVDAANHRYLSVGHVRFDVEDDGEYLLARCIVQDLEACAAIGRGDLLELSAGYMTLVVEASGEWNGQRYDAIQTRIRYNHVALIPPGTGRAGPECRLMLDSNGFQLPPRAAQETTMATNQNITAPAVAQERRLKVDGVEHGSQSDELVVAIAKLQSERDEQRGRADGLAGELKAAKDRIAELEDPARLDAAVEARTRLVADAKRLAGDGFEAKGDEAAVMRGAIEKAKPGIKLDGVSTDELRGRFKALVESAGQGKTDAVDELQRAIVDARDAPPAAQFTADELAAKLRDPAQRAAYAGAGR